MIETIWNSDKFAADDRPDWVKSILRGGHNVTAMREGDRWYFKPTIPKEKLPVGYSVNLYKGDEKIPSIWNGKKFVDMREPEGKQLREKHSPQALRA